METTITIVSKKMTVHTQQDGSISIINGITSDLIKTMLLQNLHGNTLMANGTTLTNTALCRQDGQRLTVSNIS